MNLTNLISALIAVESGGNDLAIGDGVRAIGPLQIHRCVVEDVNKRFRTQYVHSRMTNRAEAVEVFRRYVLIYAPNGTPEEIARTWNGGPSGDKKSATLGYWRKVKKELGK